MQPGKTFSPENSLGIDVEAFLLTLDVLAIILLCRGVKRVSLTNKPEDLGWLAYADRKVAHRKHKGL